MEFYRILMKEIIQKEIDYLKNNDGENLIKIYKELYGNSDNFKKEYENTISYLEELLSNLK